MQKPDVLKRLENIAGEDFDSRECRVTNPRITARDSIEIANYVKALEHKLWLTERAYERLHEVHLSAMEMWRKESEA